MQGKPHRVKKRRAPTREYVSPNQLTIVGFETPFEKNLDPDNRWVKMAAAIPWDIIIGPYNRLFQSKEGRPPVNGRIILGAMIIKHLEVLSDRATIEHIQENLYMQYFLGYPSFDNEAPFSATLFVEIRKRINFDVASEVSNAIALHGLREFINEPFDSVVVESNNDDDTPTPIRMDGSFSETSASTEIEAEQEEPMAEHRGKLLMDATVAPQNITFPTDVKLLNKAREKSEKIIDRLYIKALHGEVKPRTYRNVARKDFLNIVKKKQKSYKAIYKAIGQQLRYLRRNLRHIEELLQAYKSWPLKHKELRYVQIINTLYQQQDQMYRTRVRRVDHRIVSLHQPHVRAIVRGKEKNKTEFGSKLQVSLVNGYTFVDKLSWEAFNEGQELKRSVELYKERLGFYPAEVLADQIYCNQANRRWLKELGIKLMAKPLGRPPALAVAVHLRPGERNQIEGKFGQAKTAYGMDNIKAKLQDTSESWIVMIAIVLNLVLLTRQALASLLFSILKSLRLLKISWNKTEKSLSY